MVITPEKFMTIRALADNLIASHGGDNLELLDQVHALTLEECQVLDTIALECQSCNHWLCVGEIGENQETGEYECHDCGDAA